MSRNSIDVVKHRFLHNLSYLIDVIPSPTNPYIFEPKNAVVLISTQRNDRVGRLVGDGINIDLNE